MTESPKILLIEDDSGITDTLKRVLVGCVGHGDELSGERPLWGPSEGNHELKATACAARPCGEEG